MAALRQNLPKTNEAGTSDNVDLDLPRLGGVSLNLLRALALAFFGIKRLTYIKVVPLNGVPLRPGVGVLSSFQKMLI